MNHILNVKTQDAIHAASIAFFEDISEDMLCRNDARANQMDEFRKKLSDAAVEWFVENVIPF